MMILKLGIQHHEPKVYKIYRNNDFGLTFIARSNLDSYAFKLGKHICIIFQIKTCNDQAKLLGILIRLPNFVP